MNNQPSPFVCATSALAIGAALALSLADPAAAPVPAGPTHVVVWREPGRYGGWPANHGIWSWGNEILVGFSAGHMKADAVEPGGPARHPIDRTRPEQHLLARSLDGGATWKVERNTGLIPPPQTQMAGVPTEEGGSPERPFPGADDLHEPRLPDDVPHGRHQQGAVLVLHVEGSRTHVAGAVDVPASRTFPASRLAPTTSSPANRTRWRS